MTQADQLLASLAVLRRQWRRRIMLEALAWVALAALIGLVAGWVVTWIVEPAGTGLVAIRVLAYGLIGLSTASSSLHGTRGFTP